MTNLIGLYFLIFVFINTCYTIRKPPLRCYKEVPTQDCFQYSYKYHADMTEGKCNKFTSGGCGGDQKGNVFPDWMSCMNTCFNFPKGPKYDWWDVVDE